MRQSRIVVISIFIIYYSNQITQCHTGANIPPGTIIPPYASYGSCPVGVGGSFVLFKGNVTLTNKLPTDDGIKDGHSTFAVLNSQHISFFEDEAAAKNCTIKPIKSFLTDSLEYIKDAHKNITQIDLTKPQTSSPCLSVKFSRSFRPLIPGSAFSLCFASQIKLRLCKQAFERILSLRDSFRLFTSDYYGGGMISTQDLLGQMNTYKNVNKKNKNTSDADYKWYYFPQAPQTVCSTMSHSCLSAPVKVMNYTSGIPYQKPKDVQVGKTWPVWDTAAPISASREQRWNVTFDKTTKFVKICQNIKDYGSIGPKCITAPSFVRSWKEEVNGKLCTGNDFKCSDIKMSKVIHSNSTASTKDEYEGGQKCLNMCKNEKKCKAWTFAGAGRNGTVTKKNGRCCLLSTKPLNCTTKISGSYSGIKGVQTYLTETIDFDNFEGGPNKGKLLLEYPSKMSSSKGKPQLHMWSLKSLKAKDGKQIAKISLARGGLCLTSGNLNKTTTFLPVWLEKCSKDSTNQSYRFTF